MVAALIRDKISAAVRAEQRTGQLGRRLEQLLPELRQTLVLPEKAPIANLLTFITEYVESVPGSLLLVTAVSKHLGFYDYASPFLELAEEYFLHPPQDLPADDGLEALLDEAFLAHRLLEEVNDHHIRHLQRPLLPIDMTEANVIVHHLLGDELANKLDLRVHETAARLLEREYVWERVRALPAGAAETTQLLKYNKQTWPSRRIRLRLASEAS
ncbi:MAG: hypothetical protein H6984_01995 [Pseudomonadales bacterium]|nr:hypothetical protein [Halioglobus sp.]MCP5121208.1 hypothetical protein [Pseudomonadales bacterium]MCP5193452.1 hypothetical protein [Pseudomonadales bacterium]